MIFVTNWFQTASNNVIGNDMRNIIYNHLCRKIKEFLIENKETTTSLGERSTLSGGAVRRILTGSSDNPTITTISKLAEAMNMSIHELLGSEQPSILSREKQKKGDLVTCVFNFLLEKDDSLEGNINFSVAERIYKGCVEHKGGEFDPAFAEFVYETFMTQNP